MRIVSLLPSSTEIVFALGLGDQLVGVSHECDHPAVAAELPSVTATTIDAKGSSADIDRQVRELTTQGLSVYQIDELLLERLAPDLILTQDTCEVCAVSFADVERATANLVGNAVDVVSLSPLSLDDVLGTITAVGVAAGVEARAAQLVTELRSRLAALRARTARLAPTKVLVLEWLSPPMIGGHWTPELIRIAGGDPVLGHDAAPTGPVAWDTIAAADPDHVLIIPCGFGVDQSLRELPALYDTAAFAALRAVRAGNVCIIDGNAYFNRPGPRLVDSAQLAAVAIRPDTNSSSGAIVEHDIGNGVTVRVAQPV